MLQGSINVEEGVVVEVSYCESEKGVGLVKGSCGS